MTDQIDTSENQNELFGGEVDASSERIFEEYSKIDQLHDTPNQKWPERLADFHDLMEDYFNKSLKLDDKASHKHADQLTSLVAQYFGGRPFYMPKGKSLTRSLRDIEIYKKYTGRNQEELAEEYDISTAQIYAIISKQRKLRQRKLF